MDIDSIYKTRTGTKEVFFPEIPTPRAKIQVSGPFVPQEFHKELKMFSSPDSPKKANDQYEFEFATSLKR